jgi:hypothetical protein
MSKASLCSIDHHHFAAISTFGAGGSGSSGTLTSEYQDNNPTLHAGHLSLIEELERHIEAFDVRIEKLLAPLRDAVAQLITIPGVSQVRGLSIDMGRQAVPVFERELARPHGLLILSRRALCQ